MYAQATLRCCALLLLLVHHTTAKPAIVKPAAGLSRVIVSYSESGGRYALKTSWKAALAPHGVTIVHHSHADRFAILEGPLGGHALEQVAGRLPGVVAVEQDHRVYLQSLPQSTPTACSDSCQVQDQPSGPSGKETLPYGVTLVQAVANVTAGAVTLLGNGVSVCVVDTGIDTAHPDLKANNFTGCSAAECGYAYDQPDLVDPAVEGFHGTHVTGTIAAVRGNGMGVVGVVPRRANIYGINVAGDNAYFSSTMTAMLVCEYHLETMKKDDPAARMVVQMSFGSNVSSNIEQETYARLYARGDMLFVAAAGNYQESNPGSVWYPAGYGAVVSVAAVDCNSTVAPFSQQNADVELAAPGVAVLSTLPPFTSVMATVSVSSAGPSEIKVDANPFQNSGFGKVTGGLVDCGFGFSPCKGAKGKVCLISRGNTTFACKANNAAAGGCVGVLIYNNLNPPCLPLTGGVMVSPTCLPGARGYLPAVALSRQDGLTLQALAVQNGTVVSLAVEPGAVSSYGMLDGTSMATPHVSGVAARVWAANPGCTNAELRSALQRSAKDLGPRGRDPAYGYGLVQAQAAEALLVSQPCKGAPLT